MTTDPSHIPAAQFPRFVPIDQHRLVEHECDKLRAAAQQLAADNAALRHQLAEAQQQPLIAVMVEREPCQECERLRKRLVRVRELLKGQIAEGVEG